MYCYDASLMIPVWSLLAYCMSCYFVTCIFWSAMCIGYASLRLSTIWDPDSGLWCAKATHCSSRKPWFSTKYDHLKHTVQQIHMYIQEKNKMHKAKIQWIKAGTIMQFFHPLKPNKSNKLSKLKRHAEWHTTDNSNYCNQLLQIVIYNQSLTRMPWFFNHINKKLYIISCSIG